MSGVRNTSRKSLFTFIIFNYFVFPIYELRGYCSLSQTIGDYLLSYLKIKSLGIQSFSFSIRGEKQDNRRHCCSATIG